MKNTTVRLAQRPEGAIDDNTFAIQSEPVAELGEGEIRVAVEYVSVDPAMRTWLSDFESYVPPVAINEVMRAGGIGEIIESRSPDFSAGDKVQGLFGAQRIYSGPPVGVMRLDSSGVAIQHYLGGAGGTGFAAYFGLLNVGVMKEGDVVVVSAAAGAVGHIAVQIAKLKGNRVIGIAGGIEKCRQVVEEYGADACIDYKSEDVGARMAELCPDGIDVYFDNVGAEILENAMDNLAMYARIVICGAISEYDNLETMHAPRNYINLIGRHARMEGFVTFHYAKQYREARAELLQWHGEGKLQFRDQIEEGIENFPDILKMLFEGRNSGKLLVRV